jgi:hypothetical protein
MQDKPRGPYTLRALGFAHYRWASSLLAVATPFISGARLSNTLADVIAFSTFAFKKRFPDAFFCAQLSPKPDALKGQ